ncbi:hypothetical protein ATCC51562_770 [Campylobacter concisus ATCC 51562]|uniref:Uncharacterized protein n=1 Tax=Campylobacter concisus ATCC 51562 TaxID=1242969 RepID=U2F4N4_9BACT|nr:hypothetical protein ATCC51562_770 [Campylobacter concisus ATCC 51562]
MQSKFIKFLNRALKLSIIKILFNKFYFTNLTNTLENSY